MARDKRDEVHIDDNFDMVDLAMAMRRLASLKLLLLLAIGDHATRKMRQWRPATHWRDDLDKILEGHDLAGTAQVRLTWRRHAGAFAHARETGPVL